MHDGPRFSFNEHYAPGTSLEERLSAIQSAGIDTVELDTRAIRNDDGKSARRALEASGIGVSSICGPMDGCLLSDDPKVRSLAIDDLKRLLAIGGEMGAQGLVLAPLVGPARLPDLRPWKSPQEVHDGLLLTLLADVAETATISDCAIWLEPLNRYRTQYISRLEQAASICDELNSPAVRVMVDTFHLALEEARPGSAVARHLNLIDHVHAVDSNRRLPGEGSFDFAAVFHALRTVNYDGYIAFECRVDDDFAHRVGEARRHVEQAWYDVAS